MASWKYRLFFKKLEDFKKKLYDFQKQKIKKVNRWEKNLKKKAMKKKKDQEREKIEVPKEKVRKIEKELQTFFATDIKKKQKTKTKKLEFFKTSSSYFSFGVLCSQSQIAYHTKIPHYSFRMTSSFWVGSASLEISHIESEE